LLGEGYAYVARGHPDSALEALRAAPERTLRLLAATAVARAALGQRSEARRTARELEQLRRARYVQGDAIASIYGAFGDHDTAFHWLEVAIADRLVGVLYLPVHPTFAPLHKDPRVASFAERAVAR
jgi:predicted house-cleaning NTP pyrophosphatase (Maf/HAM1 superfamily)